MILAIMFTSMFPPHNTPATASPSLTGIFPAMRAARGTAPAPSTTVFSRSRRRRIALAISSSSTVTMSSTSSWMMGKVRSPMRFTAMPSASVSALSRATIFPASREARAEAAAAASTPTTLTEGFRAFTATAMPEMIPPPPMGTTTVSRSGTCSRSSSPMVP